MKKLLSLIITVTMLMTSLTMVHCEDGIRVTLDGNEIQFDVPPQIINGRTLVPMRAIFEALGAEVTWNGEIQYIMAQTQNKHIDMYIGSDTMGVTKNGDTFANMVTLDVPPVIIDGRTLVPVRAVSESLDCDVQWDEDSKTVTITSSDTPALNPDTIKYDDTEERKAHYMRDFEITSIEKNADGNYDITYTLRTFLEGRGDVIVNFRCLDENGNEVDTFGGVFRGTDYTWSYHNAQATISGKTALIKLVLNND